MVDFVEGLRPASGADLAHAGRLQLRGCSAARSSGEVWRRGGVPFPRCHGVAGHEAVSTKTGQHSSSLNLLSGASLPSRVLGLLFRSHEPLYVREIARELGAAEAHVSISCTSLLARALVIKSREGHRTYYTVAPSVTAATLEAPLPRAPRRPREDSSDVGEGKADRWVNAPPPISENGDVLARLDDELALLKLEQRVALGGADPEIAALMWDSEHGTPARHRQLA